MSNVKYSDKSQQVLATLKSGFNENLRDATIFLYRAVIKKFSGSRSGKRYRIPGTKGAMYTSSAPGEPPAVRTNKLKPSYRFVVSKFIGRVGSDSSYARPLERGTSKMKPRPALQPALDESMGKIKQILNRPIK